MSRLDDGNRMPLYSQYLERKTFGWEALDLKLTGKSYSSQHIIVLSLETTNNF